MPEQNLTTQPLQGKRVLVTRTRAQASALSGRLHALGASPIEFPTIRVEPPQEWEVLDSALKSLYTMPDGMNRPYDWVVFTSANGVNICCERLRELGYEMSRDGQSPWGSTRVAAIGPATAHALARYGITADLVPPAYIAESVAAALIEDARRRGETLAGVRILLARAAEARKVLHTTLQQEGAEVDEIAAYSTVPVAGDDERGREVLALLQAQQLDILTFTSSSTVRNFMHWLTQCQERASNDLISLVTRNPHLHVACIGPITSQTARSLGLDVYIEAQEYTIDGLVEAIISHEGTL